MNLSGSDATFAPSIKESLENSSIVDPKKVRVKSFVFLFKWSNKRRRYKVCIKRRNAAVQESLSRRESSSSNSTSNSRQTTSRATIILWSSRRYFHPDRKWWSRTRLRSALCTRSTRVTRDPGARDARRLTWTTTTTRMDLTNRQYSARLTETLCQTLR